MAETMIGQDAYVRRTTAIGQVSVSQHRVWDVEQFMASQRLQAKDQATKDGVIPDAIAEVTRQEFLNHRSTTKK